MRELAAVLDKLQEQKSPHVSIEAFFAACVELQWALEDPDAQYDVSGFIFFVLRTLFDSYNAPEDKAYLSSLERMFQIDLSEMFRCSLHDCPDNKNRTVNHTASSLPLSLRSSVQSALDTIFKYKTTSEDMKCSCGRALQSITELETSPEIIICQLQRWCPDTKQKKHDTMEINREVSIGDCMYSLVAVTAHKGKVDAGHYYTLFPTGQCWRKADDSFVWPQASNVLESVKGVPQGNVDDPTAYVLAYVRTRPPIVDLHASPLSDLGMDLDDFGPIERGYAYGVGQ